ncbi:DUF6479 family protein [Streptomyces sp. NPDC058867]|uniref:DUF6479 family protein n=1 Tax=unclassified Streptomyces TaxID=2593676 RepID=UPI003688F60D
MTAMEMPYTTAAGGATGVIPLLVGIVVVALLIGMVQLGIRKRRRRPPPPRPEEQPHRPVDRRTDGRRGPER